MWITFCDIYLYTLLAAFYNCTLKKIVNRLRIYIGKNKGESSK